MFNLMKNCSGVKMMATRVIGRTTVTLKKYSPEILVGVGVVGVIYAAVSACKATLKLDDALDAAKTRVDEIHVAEEKAALSETAADGTTVVVYTEQDKSRDLVNHYVQTGKDFVKLYGPSVVIGAASIGCILGSHYILNKRNVAIMAAYKAVEQSFSDYRRRLIENEGADKDREYRYGLHSEELTETVTDEKGKEKEVKKEVLTMDPNGISQYARFFGDGDANWTKDPASNLCWLKGIQTMANNRLHAYGHLFLNEVYDMLQMKRSSVGALVGWTMDGEGDGYVDFGIFDGTKEKQLFVNGYEDTILLDFNVDGVIYDKI